ncbi:MAG: hypothetical protein ACI83B_003793 [Sediminicola sp.]|jgi:hypothetical protein
MNRFTTSIRQSIETKDWYGALMTAITLPDICGKLETPNEGSKARSVRWLKAWIEPLYTKQIGANGKEHVFLSAEDCYALRCSFLHEGASNIEEQRARKALDDFHFITPRQGMSIHCNQSGNALQLQVDIFCNEVADAIDQWAKSVLSNQEIQQRMSNLIVIHDSSSGVRF